MNMLAYSRTIPWLGPGGMWTLLTPRVCDYIVLAPTGMNTARKKKLDRIGAFVRLVRFARLGKKDSTGLKEST